MNKNWFIYVDLLHEPKCCCDKIRIERYSGNYAGARIYIAYEIVNEEYNGRPYYTATDSNMMLYWTGDSWKVCIPQYDS